MTKCISTLAGAAVATLLASQTLLASPAAAWTKSSDAALVNKMINALSPGARGGHRHKHTHRRLKGGYRHHGWKRGHRHYRGKHHYRHLDGRYVGTDHGFRNRFAKYYGYANPWIYTSRHAGHIDLEVFFHTGSARLTHRAHRVLDSLGDALSYGRLRHSYFLIGGHTDASGDAFRNLELSERRARTVKHYLVRHFGIAPRRLVTVGYGERRLAFGHNPYSAKNRRVEVRRISKREARRIRIGYSSVARY
ncbi:MAG: OmpA family protein [Pseudomonadota bacterium]